MEKPKRIFYEGSSYVIEDITPENQLKPIPILDVNKKKIDATKRIFGSFIMLFAGFKVVVSAFHAVGLSRWLTFAIGMGLGAYGVYLIKPYIPTIVNAIRYGVRRNGNR